MSKIRDLTITKKLLIAFSALVLTALAVGTINRAQLSFIRDNNEMTTHSYEVVRAIRVLLTAKIDQNTGLRGYVLTGDQEYLAPYEAGLKSFDTQMSRLNELVADNPDQLSRLAEIKAASDGWNSRVADALITTVQDPDRGITMAQIDFPRLSGKAEMDQIRAKVEEVQIAERALLDERATALEQAFSRANQATIAGAIVSLLIALFAGFSLAGSIARPIKAMTAQMRQLAGGDKSIQVIGLDRRDEVGEMAQALDVFRQNAIEADRLAAIQAAEQQAKAKRTAAIETLIASFDADVAEVLGQVAGATTQLDATAQGMSGIAEETRSQATASAGAAEQTAGNVQTVAAAAEEMAGSIQEISRQVSHSSQIADQAAGEAVRTNETVQGLAEAAQRIGAVVQLIADIAGQTNLLALNATIEAARAGEAGKGFAVVASEVKSLANQTAKATDEIAQQIQSMQSVTGETVGAIRSITGTIGSINEAMTTIAAAVEQQNATTLEISRNVQQAAIGTREVSANIAHVTAAAGETGAAASQVLGAARQLGAQAQTMQQRVETFLAGIRAA